MFICTVQAQGSITMELFKLDLPTWLLSEAKGEEATLPFLVLRFLVLNFASIHTTSMVICAIPSRK